MRLRIVGHPDDIDDRYHALPLYRERFVAVLPTGHRLANQKAIRIGDLDNEPYVNRMNCEMADFAGQEFAKQGVQVRVVFRSERDDWVLGMIRSGMGWGFFPESCTFPRDVAVRPLVEPEFSRTVSLVTVRGRPHSPAVGAFVKAARTFQLVERAGIVRGLKRACYRLARIARNPLHVSQPACRRSGRHHRGSDRFRQAAGRTTAHDRRSRA